MCRTCFLPEARPRFGRMPKTPDELEIVYRHWAEIDKLNLPRDYVTMARDSLRQLRRLSRRTTGSAIRGTGTSRSPRANTWCVILGDHGEGLGEHDLFDHGASLYSTEIHVPLLIVPPGNTSQRVVRETVSLRDVPATVVDLVGLGAGSPFPGRSLASCWRDSSPGAVPAGTEAAVSELTSPSPSDPNQGRLLPAEVH